MKIISFPESEMLVWGIDSSLKKDSIKIDPIRVIGKHIKINGATFFLNKREEWIKITSLFKNRLSI